MAREIEIKLRVSDPASARARLAEIAGRGEPAVFEVNTIFDRPDGELRRGGSALRVRQCFDPATPARPVGATLTYKGPRGAGPLKSREERETPVAEPDEVAAILARLGYQPVIRYEKRREAWALGGCAVVLDELPGLGSFIEIEGPDEAAIRAAQARLGLTEAAVVPESYVELAATHGRREADGATGLRFEPDGAHST